MITWQLLFRFHTASDRAYSSSSIKVAAHLLPSFAPLTALCLAATGYYVHFQWDGHPRNNPAVNRKPIKVILFLSCHNSCEAEFLLLATTWHVSLCLNAHPAVIQTVAHLCWTSRNSVSQFTSGLSACNIENLKTLGNV